MSNSIFLILFLSLNSAVIFGQEYSLQQVCEEITDYFNIANDVTNITLEVNFGEGNSVLSGLSTIEASPKGIAVNCTSITLARDSHIISAEVTSDFIIRTRKSVETPSEINLLGCVILTSFFMDTYEDLKLKSLTISIPELDGVEAEKNGQVESIASDQIIPYLARALRRSQLFVDTTIKRKYRRETKYANKLFNQDILYYLANVVTS